MQHLLPQPVRRAIAWLGGMDLVMLLTALVPVLGVYTFLEIADKVRDGETQAFDDGVIRALRGSDNPADLPGSRWREEIGRDLTALGGVAVLLLVTAAVVGYLLIRRLYHAMGLVIVATAGGLVLSTVLKSLYSRPRPDVVPQLSHSFTSSFPSGHSMLSAVVYLTLGALLARVVHQRSLKVYIMLVAMLLTFLVGLSRIYMGVHYPTDVLAGWSAGGVWAVLCWLTARFLQRRGAVESDVNGEACVEPS